MDITNFPPRYDASITESAWYAKWEAAGLFSPDMNSDKPTYCVTIPPPNITGSLHMGHALCYPLQDMFGRYQRLLGKNVLILPGQDHAGIATQSVVDKQLKKEGLSAVKLGREKFVERVWEWRKESGDTILHQFRSLGCAFDWSRSRFTLDAEYAGAVLKVFIGWYQRGLIFRGKRVVNWDPKLQTSVSDIETLRETRRGKLYHIRYPFSDGSGEVIIATTRPETMLADVAVAVHPSDKRYEGLVGKTITLPITGRIIPLIADLYPDPEFGTGAVKITPAHDANDYQVGVRHNLAMPLILNSTAQISAEYSRQNESTEIVSAIEAFEGLDRFEARKVIVEKLETEGWLVKVDDHEIPMVISDRSGEVIEPLLSLQWFVDQPKLAQPVIEAMKNSEVSFFPERYNRIFNEWMENVYDWNISRQLWWGHRIPIYYDADDNAYAAMSLEEAQAQAGDKPIVKQDEDVLDTWFSSGLWPFATLGWPNETADLAKFYPTQCLVTDRNIINLWVARMMMMGVDLVGKLPFAEVMIYATVLREDGKRMSKSLGTGIDPMGVIEKVGADALRYTLLSQTGENQELRYSERKTEDARNFCNKIWNATRFVLMNVDEVPSQPENLEIIDKWLLSRLAKTEKDAKRAYESYDIQSACQAMYKFFWNDICDWYIEVTKSRLSDPEAKKVPQWVLLTSFEAFIKMMHPVMPHITEELYSHLPLENKAPFLMSASWPTFPEEFDQPEAEDAIERIFEATRALRALRAELGLNPMVSIPVAYYEGDLGDGESVIRSQAWFDSLTAGKPEGSFLSTAVRGITFHLPLDGVIDLEKLKAGMERDVLKFAAEALKIETRLGNPQFVERANPDVIERDREALAELRSKIEKLEARKVLFGV